MTNNTDTPYFMDQKYRQNTVVDKKYRQNTVSVFFSFFQIQIIIFFF
jgi:hypothetical protein